VAVVGVGYLGRFHAEKYAAIEAARLVGVCDLDRALGQDVANRLDTEFFADHHDLIGKIDAVTIAADTAAHYELSRFFLNNGVHVLVEKPMTRTSREAAALNELADRHALKLQVGHVERFNPALLAVRESLNAVGFIECHRLAPFQSRGVEVNVVLDLMIHDLDVILSLVNADPVQVSAVGIAVLTDNIDIANARIEFANGAIANVTSSRVSTSAQRKFRIIQQKQYVSIDFGSGEIRRVTSTVESANSRAQLKEESWNLEKGDALLAETQAFVESVLNDEPCKVSGRDGQSALELAETIMSEIQRRGGLLSKP